MPRFPFRRGGGPAEPAAVGPGPGYRRRVRFDGVSEDWRLVGHMWVEGRLSDTLNRREAIELSEMEWQSLADGGRLEPAPGLKQIDPYDLIFVIAGEDSLPPLTARERAAFRVHKLTYDVVLDLPPYQVTGRVYLYPGTDPSVLLVRANELFIPVTHAVAIRGSERLDDPGIDTILVNRSYLRGVAQLDLRAAESGPLEDVDDPEAPETEPASKGKPRSKSGAAG